MKKLSYKNRIILYMLLFLFNVIVLGIFGIRLGINYMTKKLAVQKEYGEMLSNFAEKEGLIEQLLTDIQEHEGQIEKLNKTIPNRAEEERYLVDLSLQAARLGFELKGFTISKTSSTETEVIATLGGALENIDTLVDGISSLERLSKIESIEAKRERDEVIITTKLKIFNYSNMSI